jgi:hypothetical protein
MMPIAIAPRIEKASRQSSDIEAKPKSMDVAE